MIRIRPVRGSVAVLILWLVAACSTPVAVELAPGVAPLDIDRSEPETQTAVPEAAPTPMPGPTAADGGSAPAGGTPEALRDAIRRVVAAQEGVSAEEVAIAEIEAVAWPDASLGCPQPGTIYAQIVTPGFLVVLEVGEETVSVHTDAGRQAIVCSEAEQPASPLIPIDPDGLLDGEPWIPADG